MREFNEEEFEAESIDEAEFTKGFNWGYSLADTNEALVRGIVDEGIVSASDHAKGFEAGAMERFREKESQRTEELDSLRRGNEKDKGRELER